MFGVPYILVSNPWLLVVPSVPNLCLTITSRRVFDLRQVVDSSIGRELGTQVVENICRAEATLLRCTSVDIMSDISYKLEVDVSIRSGTLLALFAIRRIRSSL